MIKKWLKSLWNIYILIKE